MPQCLTIVAPPWGNEGTPSFCHPMTTPAGAMLHFRFHLMMIRCDICVAKAWCMSGRSSCPVALPPIAPWGNGSTTVHDIAAGYVVMLPGLVSKALWLGPASCQDTWISALAIRTESLSNNTCIPGKAMAYRGRRFADGSSRPINK